MISQIFNDDRKVSSRKIKKARSKSRQKVMEQLKQSLTGNSYLIFIANLKLGVTRGSLNFLGILNFKLDECLSYFARNQEMDSLSLGAELMLATLPIKLRHSIAPTILFDSINSNAVTSPGRLQEFYYYDICIFINYKYHPSVYNSFKNVKFI